jgi:hypothetical protein
MGLGFNRFQVAPPHLLRGGDGGAGLVLITGYIMSEHTHDKPCSHLGPLLLLNKGGTAGYSYEL